MAEELAYSRDVSPAAEPKSGDGLSSKKFLELARERFKLAEDADKEQRERELEDLRFYAGDQWPQDVKDARQGQNASNGLPPIPARPCLTINIVREPVRLTLNQERQSDMGIEIVPADDFGEIAEPIDETEIELREGLVRRIQRESQAADARTWAFARAVITGRGYYGVMTKYVGGKSWDQEVYVQRFYNQFSVLLDPAHEQPDGSDAEWGFVGSDIPFEQYKSEYPSTRKKPNRVTQADSDDEWRALGDEAPDWFTSEGKPRYARVVEYWYTTRTTVTLALLPDGSVVESTAVPEGITPVDTRSDVQKTIHWAKIDGVQVLDETEWPGQYVPIVKVLGEELQPYDQHRRTEGMVRPTRDAQKGFNFMVSRWVEIIALAPIPPLMLAAGQDEGFEEEYKLAATRTLPALHYNTLDVNGQPAPPPFRTPAETPIAPIAASVEMFRQAVQTTTTVHDPSVGKVNPALKSGKAIDAIVAQDQQGTSNYLDNLSRSIRYEALIINDLLYPIYNRPGRLARLVTGQGDPKTVLLHQPMQMQDGKPQPAQDPNAQNVQTYTLTKDARFNVAIKVTKNLDTRREQEAMTIGQLLAADPQLLTWFGDLFFKNQDGPGHTEMAERAKVMLAPPIQQMLAAQAQGQQPIPPMIQQTLAQGHQVIQQQQQLIQQLKQELDTKQVEQQGKLQITQAQESAETQRAREKNETSIAVAELGAKVDRLALFLEERARLGSQAHDHAQGAADAGHEERMAQMGHQHALEQGQQAGDQQLTAQAQQAALTPAPETTGGA